MTEQLRPAHPHLGSSDERLALYILHTLPRSVGIPFVPEHLETRRLFSQLMPGLEQVAELLVFLPLFSLAKCKTFLLLFDSYNAKLLARPRVLCSALNL